MTKHPITFLDFAGDSVVQRIVFFCSASSLDLAIVVAAFGNIALSVTLAVLASVLQFSWMSMFQGDKE